MKKTFLPRGDLTWVFFLATIVRWLGFLDTDGVFFLGAIWLVMKNNKNIYKKKKNVYLPNEKKNEHKIMTNCHNASCTIVGVSDTIVSYQQYCLYAWWYCLMQRWICDGGCRTDALQFFLGNILPFHDTVLKKLITLHCLLPFHDTRRSLYH